MGTSEYSVGKVLEVVIKPGKRIYCHRCLGEVSLNIFVLLGCYRIERLLDHGIHQSMQLIFRQVHVEPVVVQHKFDSENMEIKPALHCLDSTAGVVETRQLQ